MVSPLTMGYMIAFRCSAAPKELMRVSWDRDVGKEARHWLLCNGLIDRDDEFGRATSKGEAWLDRALATPLPVQRWVFPEDEKGADASPPPSTGGGK